EIAGARVVVKHVSHDGRWNRAGVGYAKGAVVAKRPDVVRGRAKARAEAIAPAQVFISRVDALGPRVEFGHAAERSRVPFPGNAPEGPGLAVEILAPQPDRLRHGGIGPACGPSVGISTLGARSLKLAEVGEPSPLSLEDL